MPDSPPGDPDVRLDVADDGPPIVIGYRDQDGNVRTLSEADSGSVAIWRSDHAER